MASGIKSCLVSSWRISHFDIKPVSGGSPPRERRTRGARAVVTGAFVQEMAKELRLVELFSLNIKKAENVMVK